MISNVKTTLYRFLSDVNKIIIPDIQRDYVLGSGKEKLSSLFANMIEKAKDSGDFEFSCILAHRDSENNVYIYDGQQRLTTLIYLCANLCEKGMEQSKIKTLLQKFEFRGRELANEWLRNPSTIDKQVAVDFTTYSIAELMEIFEAKYIQIGYYKYDPKEKITLEFLLHKVKFDLIFIDKISDAEQFFMDVNDGLDLKDYEIYKAELYHNAKAILGIKKFKEFALKMENEWLKFFVKFSQENHSLCEEEILVFFLKFCFRMMWIEKEKSLKDYREADISWIEEKHFIRIECILDSVIVYMSQERNKQNKDASCINYSCPGYPKMGEHWNILDENYTEMLTIFIQNLSKFEQNKKDVVMWCFLSNLSFTMERDINIIDLYDYLRFIKKILNANRRCNENSVMKYGYSIEKHRLYFALYYVKDIPEYYLNSSEQIKTDMKEMGLSHYLYSIVVANRDIKLSKGKCYAKYFLEKCENEQLEKVLYNESLKYKSTDKEIIQEYENLPFINGIVDNFVQYRENCCFLKEWIKKFSPNKLYEMVSCNEEGQYIEILRFMCDELVFSEQILIKNVRIYWYDYQEKFVGYEKGDIVFHTWCDFFTQKSVLEIQDNLNSIYNHLLCLPDGWINEKYLCQIAETTAEKVGFSAQNPRYANRVKRVFDLSSFLTNFENVCISKEKKYVINGREEVQLPDFLASYNGNNWINDKLRTKDSVYYSSDRYLNQILLKMFQRDNGYSFDEFSKYIEYNLNKLQYAEIEGKRYFIKLDRVI